MEVRQIRSRIIDYLSGDPNGRVLLDALLKTAVEHMLELGRADYSILRDVVLYRSERDPASARHLLSLMRPKSCEIFRSVLKPLRPANLDERTLLEAVSLVRRTCDERQGLRLAARLAAGYVLSGRDELVKPEELVEIAKFAGDMEAFRAGIAASGNSGLLAYSLGLRSPKDAEPDRMPHAFILYAFREISAGRRYSAASRKDAGRFLQELYNEYSSAGRNPHTATLLDRARVLARFSREPLLEEPYPGFALELERLLIYTLRSRGPEGFKSIRPRIEEILSKAASSGVSLTDNTMLAQAFVGSLEDLVIGLRYRGRELSRSFARFISYLLPSLNELIQLSAAYQEPLLGIQSLYPDEIYAGRYIHVAVEAYAYGLSGMIRTKSRIFKKTLSNLVQRFADDRPESQAKAASRAVTLAEARGYVRGLFAHAIRKHESATLYQELSPIINTLDDRLVRLYMFMRALRHAYEGLLHAHLARPNKDFRGQRSYVAGDIEELSEIVSATVHTLAEHEKRTIELLGLSFSLRILDAIAAIIRLLSISKAPTRAEFAKLHRSMRRILEEAIPLVEFATKNTDVFRIVEYPSMNPIFSVVVRRYQIVDALRRSAVYMHLYELDDAVPGVREYADEKTLTAMEPRIFPLDPDVLAVFMPVSGGKFYKIPRYSKGT